ARVPAGDPPDVGGRPRARRRPRRAGPGRADPRRRRGTRRRGAAPDHRPARAPGAAALLSAVGGLDAAADDRGVGRADRAVALLEIRAPRAALARTEL